MYILMQMSRYALINHNIYIAADLIPSHVVHAHSTVHATFSTHRCGQDRPRAINMERQIGILFIFVHIFSFMLATG